MYGAILLKRDKEKWEKTTAEEVAEIKKHTAIQLSEFFLSTSSKDNYDFLHSFDTLVTQTHADFVAEVCGDEKKFNKYQYYKFMRSTSNQYFAVPNNTKPHWGFDETPKDELEVHIKFEITDKNGIKTEMHYDVSLKALFDIASIGNSALYSIIKVVQGGTCLEHGTFAFSSSNDAEDVEKLQSHPDAKAFFNLITPRAYQLSNDDKFAAETVLPNSLPSDWLLGLTPDAKLTVCHEKDTADYTKKQFLSWYQRFVQMWHPKKGDAEAMKMQVLELKDGVLVARLTFKLQIGVDEAATVHNWNFKISAKMNDDKTWSITQLDVLCTPTINLMDESYLVYRDVVGATFNSYVQDDQQWYFATNFGGHFRKKGVPCEVWSCDERMEKFADLPKSFFVQGELWTATVIGYMNLEPLEPVPAAEDTSFTIRVKMQHPTENALYKPPKGYILGVDWQFHIKWDKMDQFYYIYKANFKCPRWMHEETNQWTWVLGRGTFQRLGRK